MQASNLTVATLKSWRVSSTMCLIAVLPAKSNKLFGAFSGDESSRYIASTIDTGHFINY